MVLALVFYYALLITFSIVNLMYHQNVHLHNIVGPFK